MDREACRLQSIGLQRVGHTEATENACIGQLWDIIITLIGSFKE